MKFFHLSGSPSGTLHSTFFQKMLILVFKCMDFFSVLSHYAIFFVTYLYEFKKIPSLLIIINWSFFKKKWKYINTWFPLCALKIFSAWSDQGINEARTLSIDRTWVDKCSRPRNWVRNCLLYASFSRETVNKSQGWQNYC